MREALFVDKYECCVFVQEEWRVDFVQNSGMESRKASNVTCYSG